jgi:beta-barrel assembly-enhancing protease
MAVKSPCDVPMNVRYFDGQSGTEHLAILRREGPDLVIAGPAGIYVRWPLARIRVGKPDPDGVIAVWCKGGPARVLAHRTAMLPELVRRRSALEPLAWLAVAVAAFAAGAVVVRTPELAARIVPRSVEDQLGVVTEAVLVQPHHVCRGAQGQRALERLEMRIAQSAGIGGPIHVVVLDDPMVNALALPGDRVVIMKGLVEQTGDSNQLAGVMAHETAHIAGHDPLHQLVRNLGIRAIAAMFGVDMGLGNMSSLAGQLVSLSYSRDVERAADQSGVKYLAASGLRSDGLAAFFAALPEHKADGGVAVFLSDHPLTADREKLNAGSPFGEDAMTHDDWQAVRAMCE